MLLSLAIASKFLKAVFFAALTHEDLSTSLTIVITNFSLHGAHLACMSGWAALAVSPFLPPPRSITSTDLALHMTPVATATLRPTVSALGVLLKCMPRVITLHYLQYYHAPIPPLCSATGTQLNE
ncbi:hypothetical protein RhiJN_11948 [Ceratobasidium sp. AG-Ba]|nr:hypothetical protein RhiJN_11948 [Ceratobasidium sp. AG-Ba]QRW12560.1 hypothetical protein RhiLY_11559 [Ceratobasidium sp. AG-Ba]